eukprot:jgi/Botrbrau1/5164/Bobra.0172s0036.1
MHKIQISSLNRLGKSRRRRNSFQVMDPMSGHPRAVLLDIMCCCIDASKHSHVLVFRRWYTGVQCKTEELLASDCWEQTPALLRVGASSF